MESGAVTPKREKEATILELSERIGKQLAELTESLYERFRREPRPESSSTISPRQANVLDEIIANLEDGHQQLTRIIGLLHSDVFSKIS